MTVLAAEPGRLAYAQAYAERRLGRPLTAAERRVDLVHTDRVLARGKERLHAAIQREVRRVVEQRLRGVAARMELTREMVYTLLWLNNEGRKAAIGELRQMGIRPEGIRSYASPPIPPSVEGLALRTRSLIGSVQLRVEAATLTELGMGGLVSNALAARLAETIPGALDAASRVVSSGFIDGTGDVFSQHTALFTGYEISAVSDARTCGPCRTYDGNTYSSLEEVATVMASGGWGPNMYCLGDGRCRCRSLPLISEAWGASTDSTASDAGTTT